MNAPARNQDIETLFVTDDELLQRLGVNASLGKKVLARYDALKTGFPPKDPIWGGRRYWPAVKAFFDKTYRVKSAVLSEEPR